ncbi:hypothetical protein FNT36_10205 [Hymenobacter setariae]|uniref:DUF6438 domain-containing protein n=1 Tax=Hymenobacter setariae TaxID=2594794 RepID=A0A558BZ36_9BACT|nr:DUF6438 domain-containing protein [Hymenobacter setariae]TVT41785.1 hypothetical protein FNT36_10205 [Hymenobacter setariae]
MRHFAYPLAFVAGLSACSQHATPQQPTFQKPRTVSTIPIHTFPSDTALVFQRTPCYGTCPAYTATVFRNGKVSYNGERSVPVMGQHTFSLDQATVAAMLDEARRRNFNSLEHSYHARVTDLPATIITTYLPGQKHYQVMAERGAAPQPLQGYIDYLGAKLDPLAGLSTQR